MNAQETLVKIETQVVNIPGVEPLFRRVHKTAGGEVLSVEYMTVVYGDVLLPTADTRPAMQVK